MYKANTQILYGYVTSIYSMSMQVLMNVQDNSFSSDLRCLVLGINISQFCPSS